MAVSSSSSVVVGEQDGVMAAGEFFHRLGQRFVAGRKVGHEGKRADSHHEIGSQRRQHVGRVDVGENADGDGMRRMQMHHRRCIAPLSVHAKMQERFLGRGISADEPALRVEFRQPRGIERAERGVGRRHQPTAVRQPHADVAGRPEGEAALEYREPDGADFVAGSDVFGHGWPLRFRLVSKAIMERVAENDKRRPLAGDGLFRPVLHLAVAE